MRHSDTIKSIPAEARGLVRRRDSARHFQLLRREPSPSLAHLVKHYWQVSWDLRGRADYLQQNLPHPSVHLSLGSDGFCGIRGVVSQCFYYRLSGRGRVLGVKFHPGAFAAFYPVSAHQLTDRRIALSELWAEDESPWISSIASTASLASIAEKVETLLAQRAGSLPTAAVEVRQWVDTIFEQPELCSAHALARQSGVSVRTLQRLFRRYVGVSPKWVIDRYRLIEAVESLNTGARVDLTELACRLGYFDHAHFSKAFRALVGIPPSQLQGS